MAERNNDSSSENLPPKTKQQFIEQLDHTVAQKFPEACYRDHNNVLRIKTIEELEADRETSERDQEHSGRGGNNAAQNFKKALRGILRRKLKGDFAEFDQRYFVQYRMRSQKENFFLIFLFLHEFVALKRLPSSIIREVGQVCRAKNLQCIRNSQHRMEDRRDFHEKNIKQLSKYLHFNVDYSTHRTWAELEDNIRSLFLKKMANADVAVERVKAIIMSHDYLKNLFVDLANSEGTIGEGIKITMEFSRVNVNNH